jgi:1-acyl-sn-glycerol-3-phosphate acyltransferase
VEHQATVESVTLSNGSLATRIFKLGWGIIATLLCVAYTAILSASAAMAVLVKRRLWVYPMSRLWAWLIMKTCGIRVEFQGLENLNNVGSCVLVANHQSFVDIFALLAFFPREVRFIAKKELLKIPVFGFAFKRSRHIVIDRSTGHAIRKAFADGFDNSCIGFFAEGHRHNDGQVHPFNEGAAWLAIQAKLPCVPMAIIGSGAFFPRGAKVVVPGGRMRIRLGKPIETTNLKSSDRAALTSQLETAVGSMFSPTI